MGQLTPWLLGDTRGNALPGHQLKPFGRLRRQKGFLHGLRLSIDL